MVIKQENSTRNVALKSGKIRGSVEWAQGYIVSNRKQLKRWRVWIENKRIVGQAVTLYEGESSLEFDNLVAKVSELVGCLDDTINNILDESELSGDRSED